MDEVYFIFNNISSVDYLDIKKLPSIFKAEKDIEKIEVEGRDGFLTIDKGAYKGIIKSCECQIKHLEDIDFICSWLDGNGEVVFSNEPDKMYKATIINQIEVEQLVQGQTYHTFTVLFESQPHKYSLDNNVVTLTSVGTLYNVGSTISKPVIKVFGTGSITLTINGLNVYLTNVSEYVTLDSNLEDAFKDSVYKNTDMQGEFPVFEVGQNTISWSGSITKLEIQPNWRWK